MDVEKAIRTRRTHKAFSPVPLDAATLDGLFELASWAPNHNLTNPWRFRVLGPRTLARLKDLAEELSPGSAAKLDRAPTLQRPPERELVGVLEVAAHGEPAGDARDFNREIFQ